MENDRLETTPEKRWWSTWNVVGPFFFGLAFLGSVTRGFETQDETWFVQVIHRVVSGEVLYRDVFYGATPLAVYVTVPFASVFGSEMIVNKAVNSLCFTLMLLMCCRVAGQLGSKSRFPLLVILPLYLYVSPQADTVASLYTPLANLFYVSCLSACLPWFDDPCKLKQNGSRLLLFSGIAAGLTLATKHNYGFFVTAALFFALALRPGQSGETPIRRMGTVMGVLLLVLVVALVVLLPVWWGGGLPALLEFGFKNKQNYMQFARLEYFDGLKMVAGSPVPLFPYLLPWPTLALLVLAWLRADSLAKRRIAVVIGFVVMNCLGNYPRADLAHVRHVVPVCVLGWLCAWYELRISEFGPVMEFLRKAVTLCFVATFSLQLIAIWFPLTSRDYQFSTLKHFRGTLVRKDVHSRMEAWRTDFSEKVLSDQPVFFVSTDAAFYYLLTQRRNPTSFDFPLVPAFGPHGEEDVANAFAQGKIDKVLLDLRSYEAYPNMKPTLLIRSVLEHGEPDSEIGFSKIYRNRRLQ
jgi:hypothetical protein